MRYIFQLLPTEPLCSQLQELRQQVSSLVGPNQALNYPTPHVTLLHSIADNAINSIQASDQLIATLPALKEHPPLTLPAKLLNQPDIHLTIALKDSDELTQMRDTLQNEVLMLQQQGQLSSGPVEETWPHLTLAQNISSESQAIAREYMAQNVTWLPEIIEFDQVVLLSRDVTLNQPYRIIARTTLRQVVEQQ